MRTRAIVSRDAVTFQDLSAALDGGTLQGRGFLSFVGPIRDRDFDLDVELERFPAAGLPYRSEGRLSGNLRASRHGEQREGEAQLELTEGRMNGVEVSRASTRIDLASGRIRFDPLAIERGGAVLDGQLELDPKARTLEGSVKAERLGLDGIAPSWAGVEGLVDGEIEL